MSCCGISDCDGFRDVDDGACVGSGFTDSRLLTDADADAEAEVEDSCLLGVA